MIRALWFQFRLALPKILLHPISWVTYRETASGLLHVDCWIAVSFMPISPTDCYVLIAYTGLWIAVSWVTMPAFGLLLRCCVMSVNAGLRIAASWVPMPAFGFAGSWGTAKRCIEAQEWILISFPLCVTAIAQQKTHIPFQKGYHRAPPHQSIYYTPMHALFLLHVKVVDDIKIHFDNFLWRPAQSTLFRR